ncbi:MAG: aldehyde dehydrogenase family protein [Halobacteriota archaeon]|jgi:1-pyrroline-5-carboxylate dehydrogenase
MPKKKKLTYTSLLDSRDIHRGYEQALETVQGEFGQHHPMFIGGRRVAAIEDFETRSPIDNDIVIGTFQKGGETEAQSAVVEAKQSFISWSQIDWAERLRITRAVADRLEKEDALLAALMTYEVGKNRSEALAEVCEAVEMLRYNCAIYEEQKGFTLPMSQVTGERSTSTMRPYGVWAIISPFNFPLVLAAGMISAALLTGNTVVFKPTSKAPLTGLKLYAAWVQAGVPGGALNMITGPGKPFGAVAAAHPDVAGIAFTGSRDAGMWLQRNFSVRQPYPKPFVAEMGSKNPAIVTASADLDKAVEGVLKGAFGYSGQKCSATSRVYVEAAVASDFIERLRVKTEQVIVGDPRKSDVFVGPLIDQAALTKFADAVKDGLADGGAVITGGKVLRDGVWNQGCYVRPTIMTGLPRGHRLFNEELFVPFLLIDTITSLEEGLRESNDTEYGLTAGIFSENEGEVARFFASVQFGVCYANRRGGATTGAWPGVQPFGGWKASGVTGKGVGGPYYLLSYVREQTQTRA